MPATLQRYADRQNIHAIGGVVGDLGDGLADDGRKVGLVRIEAQLGAAPDIGHMMQAIKIAVIGGAVNGLYFYPKEVQDRAIELGLIDRNTMNRKRKCFMIPFFIVMLAALVLIIGLWNGASSFGEAYWQALLFLEVMNVYDGVVIDKLWVGHSRFWVLPGLEDAPFVQTWRQVLKRRSILALIWVVGAAIVGGIVVLIF